MAIEETKITQSQQTGGVQSAATTTPTTSTSQTQVSKPIPVGEKKEQDPVTAALSSEEFQKLSDEEKIAQLKKQFPGIPEEQLRQTLITFKTTVATQANSTDETSTTDETEVTSPEDGSSTAPTTSSTAQSATTATSGSTPAGEQTSTAASGTTAVTIETAQTDAEIAEAANKVLDDYAKEHQIKDIDSVIAAIKQKDPATLTDNEKVILSYVTGDRESLRNLTMQQKIGYVLTNFGDKIQNLIPDEVKNSREWNDKTPVQRLDARADAILGQIIPNYETMNDADKENARNNFYTKIASSFMPSTAQGSLDSDDILIAKGSMAIMLDLAEESDVPLSQLLSKDKKTLQKEMSLAVTQMALSIIDLDMITNQDPNSKWLSSSPEKRFEMLLTTSLQNLFPDLLSQMKDLSKLEKLGDVILDRIGKNHFGAEWSGFDENGNLSLSDKAKLNDMLTDFAAAKYHNMPIKDYYNLTPGEKAEYRSYYMQESGIPIEGTDKVRTDAQIYHKDKKHIDGNDIMDYLENKGLRNDVAKALGKDVSQLTDDDVLNYYRKLRDKGVQLTDEQQEYAILLRQKHYAPALLEEKREDPAYYFKTRVEAEYGGDWKKFALDLLAGRKIEDLSEKDKRELINRAGTVDDYKSRRALCKALGLNPRKYIDKDSHRIFAEFIRKSENISDKNERANLTEDYAKRITDDFSDNPKERAKLTDDLIDLDTRRSYDDAEYLAKNQIRLIGVVGDEFADSFAKSQKEHCTFDTRLAVGDMFNRSDDVSDGAKTLYTQTSIEISSPDEQNALAELFSKIQNQGVTQGLINAEPSVDQSVRNSYSQHVDNAINNNGYDSNTRQNLNNYRTEVHNNYNSSSNSGNTSQTSQNYRTNYNSNPGSASQSAYVQHSGYQSPVAGRTSSPSQPYATNYASQQDSQISQPATQNYAEQVTRALSEKQDRVQERLTEIIDNFQRTTKAQTSARSDDSNLSVSERAVVQQAKQAEKETVGKYIDQAEKIEKLPPAIVTELRNVYNSSGMAGLYTKLGSLGSNAQEKFLSFFARYSNATSLHSFATSFMADKNVLLQLYQYSNDPTLIAYLGEGNQMALLNKGKIKLKDFLKFASPSTVAQYIRNLNKSGNVAAIREITGLLSISQQDLITQNISSTPQSQSQGQPERGTDEWLRQMNKNMSVAAHRSDIMDGGIAMGSDKVSMGRSYDRMKQRGPFYFSA